MTQQIFIRGYQALRARNAAVLCLSAALLCASVCPASAENSASEYAVKAAYLYQFGKFVEWPAQHASGDLFSICTMGDDPFGPVLDQIIAGRTVQGMHATARRLGDTTEVGQCDILFISRSESGRLAEVLEKVQGKRILTVGDSVNFLSSGGMINFEIERNKVRFDISLHALESVGLRVSSQLLKVARTVQR